MKRDIIGQLRQVGDTKKRFSRAIRCVLLEVGHKSAIGSHGNDGESQDWLELENQRGLAISSERGCLLPGLCRIA